MRLSVLTPTGHIVQDTNTEKNWPHADRPRNEQVMAPEPPEIAIVDDDMDFLELYRHVLESRGYRVRCFGTPAAALEGMAQSTPDLVISDLMMERLDAGFSFARQVKSDERFREVPVIIATAAGSQRGFDFRPRGAADLAAMNADAFFAKPVDPEALLAKIRELVSARAASSSGTGRKEGA